MWFLLWFLLLCLSAPLLVSLINPINEVNKTKAEWMGKNNIWDIRLKCTTKDDVSLYCNSPREFIQDTNQFVICDGPKSRDCARRLHHIGYNNIYFCKDYIY